MSSLYWGSEVGPIVFDWWQVHSPIGLAISTFLVIWIAMAHEWLGRYWVKMQNLSQFKPIVYGLKYCLSIFLMLAIMTFNGFIILGIITGTIIGYYLFRSDCDEQIVCNC